nr:MAG TPA: hypothetical protein [Caudoviricetes sp.]
MIILFISPILVLIPVMFPSIVVIELFILSIELSIIVILSLISA